VTADAINWFSDEPGAMLLRAREAKGITVGKVAADLLVTTAVVEAMESNRFDVFGAPVYAKGFLRKYALLVDLDPLTVLGAYDGRSGGVVEPTYVLRTASAPGLRLRAPFRFRLPTWQRIATVLAVVVVLVGGYRYSGYRSGAARAVVPMAVKPVVVSTEKATSEVDPMPTQTVPSVSLPTHGDDNGALSPAPMQAMASAAVGRDELSIRGVKDAWVEVRGVDGTRLFYDHVRGGEMRTVHGAGPWRMYLSDADGVEVSLGAHIVDVPASRRSGAEARFGLKSDGTIL